LREAEFHLYCTGTENRQPRASGPLTWVSAPNPGRIVRRES
jgi:hypothetical protein